MNEVPVRNQKKCRELFEERGHIGKEKRSRKRLRPKEGFQRDDKKSNLIIKKKKLSLFSREKQTT